jgi:hypothetical protein
MSDLEAWPQSENNSGRERMLNAGVEGPGRRLPHEAKDMEDFELRGWARP